MTDRSGFRHGVASFDPTDHGVLLWTRIDGHTDAVDWLIATDPSLHEVVRSGSTTTGPEVDHTVTVDVDGLEPATSYWYRFRAGSVESPIGRTRTLPGAGVERFLLATVSCANFSVAPLGVYRALAEREVDLVLHLGDYIYEDDGSSGPRGHDPSRVATSLDDYRRRIAQIRSDPDLQALHLRHPMVTIWDDHDLSDNAWHDGAKKHEPDEHGPWPARVAAAARARQEWLPSRLRDPADPLVTWRSLMIGDLAELVLLDTRLAGRDRQAGDEESPDLHDPQRSLLGDPQRDWLYERLRDVERPWAIVASGVVVNEMELSWPRVLRWMNSTLPNGYAVLDGHLLHDDQWDGYPAERSRLVEVLAQRGRSGGRSIVLSGDVHSSWAFRGPCVPSTGEPVAVEMTTPAVSSAAMGRAHYPLLWRVLDRAANRLDHVCWADVTARGYGVLELTRSAATARWWFVHPYATDPAQRAIPAAAFRTERNAWPPAFEAVDVAFEEPERAGLPDALPPRPADLGRLRARRATRLAAETAAWALAVVAPVAVAAALLSRSRWWPRLPGVPTPR
jgi:alkaline phosphatase D